jgi:hypothetical protein
MTDFEPARTTPQQQFAPAPVSPAVPPQAPMLMTYPASPAYYRPDDKQVHIAYILLFFFAAFGVHKFYLGRVGLGIAYIFTAGFFGIGTLVDIFTLNGQTLQANAKRRQLGL